MRHPRWCPKSKAPRHCGNRERASCARGGTQQSRAMPRARLVIASLAMTTSTDAYESPNQGTGLALAVGHADRPAQRLPARLRTARFFATRTRPSATEVAGCQSDWALHSAAVPRTVAARLLIASSSLLPFSALLVAAFPITPLRLVPASLQRNTPARRDAQLGAVLIGTERSGDLIALRARFQRHHHGCLCLARVQ